MIKNVPITLEYVTKQLHVSESRGRDGDYVASSANEAKNIANMQVEAAVGSLQAHIIHTRQTTAQQRYVAVPIQAGVHMNHAFRLARAAAGVNVIRNVIRLCGAVAEGQFQKLLQFWQRLVADAFVREAGKGRLA